MDSKLTTLRDDCPNGIDCPRIYGIGEDSLIVRGARITDPALLAQLDLPEDEVAVLIPRRLLPEV